MKGTVDAARRVAAKFLDTFFGSYICSKFFKAIIQIFQQALLFKVGLGPDGGIILSLLHCINVVGEFKLNFSQITCYLYKLNQLSS